MKKTKRVGQNDYRNKLFNIWYLKQEFKYFINKIISHDTNLKISPTLKWLSVTQQK